MLQTPLYQILVDSKARMVDFAGWSMPVLFTSIIEEHNWTRQHAGLFDVSHMGRLEITGPTAGDTLEYLCTRQMVDMEMNTTRYCLMCNEQGGALDDMMVSRLDQERYYVVCNASNRQKIISHIHSNIQSGTTLVDRTFETAMIALQGPKVVPLISQLLPGPIQQGKHRGGFADSVMGIPILAFRGGYTGEDGFEIVVPAGLGSMIWAQLLAATLDGEPVFKPIGLGARDTLRLEAALPLYGHELNESIDPISAKLEIGVDFDHEYIGCKPLETLRRQGPKQVRVGLKLETRRAARQGFKIFHNNQEVGQITSGACTPTVNASIAMGFINTDLAQIDNTVKIQTGNDQTDAKIVKMPFYRRPK